MKYLLIKTMLQMSVLGGGNMERVETVEHLIPITDEPYLIRTKTTSGVAVSTVFVESIKRISTDKCVVGSFTVPCGGMK